MVKPITARQVSDALETLLGRHLTLDETTRIMDRFDTNVARIINRLTKEHYNCHLVTCGDCGSIFNGLDNQRCGDGITQYKCPQCKEILDTCDCPDLFN